MTRARHGTLLPGFVSWVSRVGPWLCLWWHDIAQLLVLWRAEDTAALTTTIGHHTLTSHACSWRERLR